MYSPRKLFSVCALLALAAIYATPAKADAILGLQNTNGSAFVDLSAITDGSYTIATLLNGSPSAGSINVTNDSSGGINSLTLYYFGVTGPANDAGSTLTCHNFNFGGGNTTCSIFDPVNGMTYSNGAATPSDLSLASYVFTWDFPMTLTGDFNIVWSSFSGSGYTGCIAGTPTCSPITATPEPPSLTLLGISLVSFMGLAAVAKIRAS